MDFNSQLLNPRMKCAPGMAEVGSRGSLHMQPGNSGLTSPKSHAECLPAAPRLPQLYVPAAVAGCRVAGPTSVPAGACPGGPGGRNIFRELRLPYQFWDNQWSQAPRSYTNTCMWPLTNAKPCESKYPFQPPSSRVQNKLRVPPSPETSITR